MPNVIDYLTGERIDPVTGKPIKRVTTGAVPTNFEDMLLPVSVGNDQFYAPGWGSNLIENVEFYDDPAPAAPKPVTQAPAIGGQIGAGQQGKGVDSRNDDKTNAGAIPDFNSWVDAVMAGTSVIGPGGPIKAVANQISGVTDYGDDFNNANQIDPAGWDEAVEEARSSLPPGTPPQQVLAHAATLFEESHPGWKEGGAGSVSGDTDGLGGVGKSSTGAVGTSQQEAEQAQSEGIGDITNEGVVSPDSFTPSITTASGTKPPKPTKPSKPTGQGMGGGGQGNSGEGRNIDTALGGKASIDNSPDDRDGRDGGGSNQGGNKGAPGGSGEAPGGHGYAAGGYVQNMPTSMSQRGGRRPTEQPVIKQPPTKTGPGPIKDPARPQKHAAFNGLRDSTAARFAQPTSKGFNSGGFVPNAGYNSGGFVPKAGYNDGGAVSPDAAAGDMQARFNPAPEQIASDGITDNQPIQADEGEFVIRREAAEILGPEILNGLNDPETALILSDLVEDVLALKGGGGLGGAPGPMAPAAGAPPTPARPAMGDAGANPSQGAMPQQRSPGVAPSGYRKGGYVTAMRGSLSKVRC